MIEPDINTTTNNNTMTKTTKTKPVVSTSSSSLVVVVEPSTTMWWCSVLVFIVNSIFLILFHFQTTTSVGGSGGHSVVASMLFFAKIDTAFQSTTTTTTTTIPHNLHNVSDDSMSLSPFNDNINYYYYPNIDMILFTSLIVMAFELLDFLTKHSGSTYVGKHHLWFTTFLTRALTLPKMCSLFLFTAFSMDCALMIHVCVNDNDYAPPTEWLGLTPIPVRGKHLDDLRRIDYYCIAFSKANTAPFTYFYLRYCYLNNDENGVIWKISSLTLSNTVVPLVAIFVLFDLFYTIFHWILHWQSLYPYIHKHHHIQKAPSRANIDAVNVHPIEFIGGEYNHLWVLYLYTKVLGYPIHIVSAVLFLVMGGILAGINHTRYDLTLAIPLPNLRKLFKTRPSSTTTTDGYLCYWTVFDSKAHDVHHRIPQSNYGQYFMLWDYLFGSYR